ncbi:MAG: hypothetical protein EZS28_010144 [Streblomastix strix]|uniref:Uncharacterized protein n=1 Tax=Streblomastix strix TaxID=222440 RepID=A0A5J4WI02_9EUKA|nr:MAG: hypothetical protein EZS28_010144 [Streblomastix strix]
MQQDDSLIVCIRCVPYTASQADLWELLSKHCVPVRLEFINTNPPEPKAAIAFLKNKTDLNAILAQNGKIRMNSIPLVIEEAKNLPAVGSIRPTSRAGTDIQQEASLGPRLLNPNLRAYSFTSLDNTSQVVQSQQQANQLTRQMSQQMLLQSINTNPSIDQPQQKTPSRTNSQISLDRSDSEKIIGNPTSPSSNQSPLIKQFPLSQSFHYAFNVPSVHFGSVEANVPNGKGDGIDNKDNTKQTNYISGRYDPNIVYTNDKSSTSVDKSNQVQKQKPKYQPGTEIKSYIVDPNDKTNLMFDKLHQTEAHKHHHKSDTKSRQQEPDNKDGQQDQNQKVVKVRKHKQKGKRYLTEEKQNKNTNPDLAETDERAKELRRRMLLKERKRLDKELKKLDQDQSQQQSNQQQQISDDSDLSDISSISSFTSSDYSSSSSSYDDVVPLSQSQSPSPSQNVKKVIHSQKMNPKDKTTTPQKTVIVSSRATPNTDQSNTKTGITNISPAKKQVFSKQLSQDEQKDSKMNQVSFISKQQSTPQTQYKQLVGSKIHSQLSVHSPEQNKQYSPQVISPSQQTTQQPFQSNIGAQQTAHSFFVPREILPPIKSGISTDNIYQKSILSTPSEYITSVTTENQCSVVINSTKNLKRSYTESSYDMKSTQTSSPEKQSMLSGSPNQSFIELSKPKSRSNLIEPFATTTSPDSNTYSTGQAQQQFTPNKTQQPINSNQMMDAPLILLDRPHTQQQRQMIQKMNSFSIPVRYGQSLENQQLGNQQQEQPQNMSQAQMQTQVSLSRQNSLSLLNKGIRSGTLSIQTPSENQLTRTMSSHPSTPLGDTPKEMTLHSSSSSSTAFIFTSSALSEAPPHSPSNYVSNIQTPVKTSSSDIKK